MQVGKTAELEPAYCHRDEVDRECDGHQSAVVAHDLGVQHLEPGRRRKQKQGVGDQVKPRAGRGRLAQPARHEPIQDIGEAGHQETHADDATLAGQRESPDDWQQEHAQPGDCVRHTPASPVHERSLACGSYL